MGKIGNNCMLKFNSKFFESEYRNDFLVEDTMKHYWACQMEILSDIDVLCKKYGITYYAWDGTLLGAIRHKGFIPWDDDLDIAMKRNDYERFIHIAMQELPKPYILLTKENELISTFGMTRVDNNVSIDFTEEHLKKFHGCPFITGIDIFPIDYVPRDEEQDKLQRRLLDEVKKLYRALIRNDAPEGWIEAQIAGLNELCMCNLQNDETLLAQVRMLNETLRSLYTEEQSDYMECKCDLPSGVSKLLLKKEWFSETVLKPFENILVPVPNGYDEILKAVYGDYWVPVRGTQAHDYPLYKSQLSMIEEYMKNQSV